MEKSVPSRLANLRELVQLLSLSVQVQAETTAILEEYEKRLYSLEEDRRRLLADYRSIDQENKALKRQFSELQYKFADFKQSMK